MSTTQGSIRMGRGSRDGNFRRTWTDREEEVLLEAFKELVVQGWKSDNGFRPGYVNKLEEALKVAVPGTTLKANPHITSKITTWKKNYASLTTILSRSGVGFNLNGDFMVDCTPEVWDEMIRVDPNASKVRSKPWPHYDAWKMIFGKDRATGENAEDVMDAVNQLFNEQHNFEDYVHVEEQADLDLGEEIQETSFTQSSDRGQRRTKRQKRSNTENNMQTMCELLGQIHRDTNERLESLGMRIGYKTDLGKARKEVFDLIKEIPGLSLDNQLVVGEILAENEKRLEFFMGLPPAARATYVQKLIMEKEK